ncbi:hypothetical protein AB0K48_40575 [Nonomuraea sp. NPDC055795]
MLQQRRLLRSAAYGVAAAVTVMGLAGAGARAAVDVAGTFRIAQVTSLAPGASASGGWNNTPQAFSHFVDAWPTTNAVVAECRIEVVRWWKEYTRYLDGSELEVHWTIKNVGSNTCGADVYLGWVRA